MSATCNLTNVTIDHRDDAVFFMLFDNKQRKYNNDIYDTIPNFHKFYKQHVKRESLKKRLETETDASIIDDIKYGLKVLEWHKKDNPFTDVGFSEYNEAGSVTKYDTLHAPDVFMLIFHKQAVLDICQVTEQTPKYEIVANILDAMYILRKEFVPSHALIGMQYFGEKESFLRKISVSSALSISERKYLRYLEYIKE